MAKKPAKKPAMPMTKHVPGMPPKGMAKGHK